jgi:CRP/FNR family transcriptional regulator, anaerobic regulatory protein
VQFGIDNWWLADLMCLDMQKPSQFNIQAVEASEIIALVKKIQEELFANLPKLERYFRIILQKAYTASIMRFRYIFTHSGEERFQHFTPASRILCSACRNICSLLTLVLRPNS